LQTDRIDKVAPLLSVAKEWSAAHPDNAQLPINLPGDYRFVKAPTEVTINFPYTSVWKHTNGSVRHYVRRLVPLFGLPWSVLSLSFRPSSLQPQFEEFLNGVEIAYMIFDSLNKGNINAPLCQGIDRITLDSIISSTAQLRNQGFLADSHIKTEPK
jgi:hypothetical protein